jgi:amino acid transporter
MGSLPVSLFWDSHINYIKGIPVDPHNTMLSQLTSQYFGQGLLYQIITWSTFVILALAANSTFTGFSQLAALVASDGYLPRSLTFRGDRLGYSNGMIVLASLSALLIAAFHARTNALIPLYAVGVFTAFTVAQLGLIRHWFRVKGSRWLPKASVNIVGACITILVTGIFAFTKFMEGAWIVLIIIPLMIIGASMVKKHYRHVAEQLKIDLRSMKPRKHNVTSVVLVSGDHKVVLNTFLLPRA